MKTLLLIDTTNLYHCIRKRYGGVLQFDAFFDWIRSMHGEFDAVSYVASLPNSGAFTEMLSQHSCVVTKSPKDDVINFNVEIAVEALREEYDKVIICSSNYDLLPLLRVLDNAYIYAVDIPSVFETTAHVREIGEEFIRRKAA